MLNRNSILTGVVAATLCEAAEANLSGGGGTDTPKAKTPTEVEKVTMLDGTGRVVEFSGKRKMLKESLFPEGELPVVQLDFRNGETRKFQIPQELLYRFAAHGAEQKLGDETAGETDVDDMVLAVDDLIERLKKLEWSVKREGGGMSGTSVLLKALMEKSGKSMEQVKAFLKTKTPAEKQALRASDQLKPIVDRMEAEKLAKVAKIDTGALLAGLDAMEAAPAVATA